MENSFPSRSKILSSRSGNLISSVQTESRMVFTLLTLLKHPACLRRFADHLPQGFFFPAVPEPSTIANVPVPTCAKGQRLFFCQTRTHSPPSVLRPAFRLSFRKQALRRNDASRRLRPFGIRQDGCSESNPSKFFAAKSDAGTKKTIGSSLRIDRHSKSVRSSRSSFRYRYQKYALVTEIRTRQKSDPARIPGN